jgi:DNA-binding NtrC family response regulator
VEHKTCCELPQRQFVGNSASSGWISRSPPPEHAERAMIGYAMRIRKGRVEQVARMLGLSRKGLHLNRQRLGIDRAES